MIQPTTTIHHVVLLQHPKTGSIGGSVGKNENLPVVLSGMCLYEILKPINLFLVDGHFVRGVLGVTEDGWTETDEEGFLRYFMAEVRGVFAMDSEVHVKIFFVGFELWEEE